MTIQVPEAQAPAEGEMEGRNVVCPCHMGTFDVTTGAVVSGPPPAPLKTWQVETG